MSLSQNVSDYQAKPAVIQTARDIGIDMSDVATALEDGDVVVNDIGAGFALIEGEVQAQTDWGSKPTDVKLYISTDEVPKAKINRLEINDE